MWGQPASHRSAGLGVPPRGRSLSDNDSDPSLESVDSWVYLIAAVARPASLPLAYFGSGFARTSHCLCTIFREVGY